jgi:cellulose synthase/poly-beta-1,6-N-acetylglucosamine synthase-like glycosyltransferase
MRVAVYVVIIMHGDQPSLFFFFFSNMIYMFFCDLWPKLDAFVVIFKSNILCENEIV